MYPMNCTGLHIIARRDIQIRKDVGLEAFSARAIKNHDITEYYNSIG